MAHNGELVWRELEERRAEVATELAGRRLAVEVEFNADGEIVRTSSSMRQRKLGQEWGGDALGWNPRRLPEAWRDLRSDLGRGYRELPERYVYWRGRVTDLELLDDPFAPSGR